MIVLRTLRSFMPWLAVSGLGFGMIAGVVAFANILKESGGPAIVGVADGGSQFFVLSSGKWINDYNYKCLSVCVGLKDKPKSLSMALIVVAYITDFTM